MYYHTDCKFWRILFSYWRCIYLVFCTTQPRKSLFMLQCNEYSILTKLLSSKFIECCNLCHRLADNIVVHKTWICHVNEEYRNSLVAILIDDLGFVEFTRFIKLVPHLQILKRLSKTDLYDNTSAKKCLKILHGMLRRNLT